MCDLHTFQFDVDKAYADQLLSVFEASPRHPLNQLEAFRVSGVYALYRGCNKVPVYVGQAVGPTGVRGRLRDHIRKIQGRRFINVEDVSYRYLIIERKWEVARAESILIETYNPIWNGIPGFSMHTPGKGCPAMPGYINEWDRRFPVIP
jgi:hypothetical protein